MESPTSITRATITMCNSESGSFICQVDSIIRLLATYQQNVTCASIVIYLGCQHPQIAHEFHLMIMAYGQHIQRTDRTNKAWTLKVSNHSDAALMRLYPYRSENHNDQTPSYCIIQTTLQLSVVRSKKSKDPRCTSQTSSPAERVAKERSPPSSQSLCLMTLAATPVPGREAAATTVPYKKMHVDLQPMRTINLMWL